MQNNKEFKKGELLFKEGDKLDQIFFIQSGKVRLFIERNGKKIEIEQLNGSQVLGELGVLNSSRQVFSAEAMLTTKVLEIPAEILKAQTEKAAPGLKLLIKSSIEGVKLARQKIKGYKMEFDDSPCPQRLIPKIFCLYPLLAKNLGKQNDEGYWVVSWQVIKNYTTRMFLESPQRVLSGIDLLKKLGYVETTTVLNEETNEEELNDVIFKETQSIEDFAEFYQYHLYKPGKSEVIYVDEMAFKIVKVLVGLLVKEEEGFKGSVTFDYESALKEVKSKTGIDIKNTHWDLLEKKGLFVQRKSLDSGLQLLLNKEEFIKTAIFWAFIHEINEWNEKGYIDFTVRKEKLSAGAGACPECEKETTEEQKFCHNCGFSLKAA